MHSTYVILFILFQSKKIHENNANNIWLPSLPWFPSTSFVHKEMVVIVIDLFQDEVKQIHTQRFTV